MCTCGRADPGNERLAARRRKVLGPGRQVVRFLGRRGVYDSDLTTAVTGHSDYTSHQTALLTCMNAGVAADDQYGSFDDILADYANATANLEGACSSQSSQMFATSQRVVKAKLNALRNGNTDYDGIMSTPQGQRFAAIAGNSAEIKRLLDLATNVETPPNLEFPVYEQV